MYPFTFYVVVADIIFFNVLCYEEARFEITMTSNRLRTPRISINAPLPIFGYCLNVYHGVFYCQVYVAFFV